jgi:hypothetical protein
MNAEGSNCDNVLADKHFPLTQLPLACPVPTPSADTTYVERDYIEEDIITNRNKRDRKYVPIKSPTPTPSITPTHTPTPSITPTVTGTPVATPTPTPSFTPTGTPPPTPTPTHLPRYEFKLDVGITLNTEALVYIDLPLKQVYIYHAVEGTFPFNPVLLQWTIRKDGVPIESGSYSWTIPWELTYGPAPRRGWFKEYIRKFTIFGWFFGFGKRKPPPPKRYPQYSDEFTLPIVSNIPLTNFKLDKGFVPDHVRDGGVYLDTLPSKATKYTAIIQLVDSSSNRAETTDGYRFQISTSNY